MQIPTVSTSPEDDAALVTRALGGDKGAFNALVLRHERPLFRFLSKAASNAADVEDAMQQAMVKAYLKLATYNPSYRFTTWLFTIALRELRTLRRRKTHAPLHDAPEPAAIHGSPAIDEGPGDLWMTARRLLTEPQFTALWLRYGEDFPARDIARVMNRPRVWVSVTLHRACAALRNATRPDAPRSSRMNEHRAARSSSSAETEGVL